MKYSFKLQEQIKLCRCPTFAQQQQQQWPVKAIVLCFFVFFFSALSHAVAVKKMCFIYKQRMWASPKRDVG